MWISGRAVVDRKHPRRAPLDRLQTGVGRDRVEPGPERASTLEPGQRRARRGAMPPAARPRHRAPSRASGSNGREAALGTARRAGRRRPRRPAGRPRAAPCSPSWSGSLHRLAERAFGCQKAISPPSGVATTLRQPAGPSRGSNNTDAPSCRARSVNRVDAVDLDVRQPQRAPRAALDDAAAEPPPSSSAR